MATSDSFKPLAIFAVEHLLLVGTIGYTIGHRVMGLQVVRLGGGLPGPVPALARTILLVPGDPAADLGPRRPRACTTRSPAPWSIRAT